MKAIDIPQAGPLAGVKVVLSGIEYAGPWAAQKMAEWGANVIWVENTKGGDTLRLQPTKENDGRNRRSIGLDCFSDEGKQVLYELVKDADIFIESSKGGTYARKGITDEALWEHNESLVIVHVSGFGLSGDPDYVVRPSFDGPTQAFTGFLSQNGFPDRPPIPSFPFIGDYLTAFTALSSALAALINARATGKGESIDVAMCDSVMSVMSYNICEFLNEGKTYPRPGNYSAPYIGWGVYSCREGDVYMGLMGAKQVEYMLGQIGMSDILGTKDYPEGTAYLFDYQERANDIQEALVKWFSERTSDEAEAELVEHRIAAAKVNYLKDLPGNSHVIARGMLTEWKTEDGATTKGISIAPRFTNNPTRIWRSLPKYGQDTQDILEENGFTSEQIDLLKDKGIIV